MPLFTQYDPDVLRRKISQENAINLQNIAAQAQQQRMQEDALNAQLQQALQPLRVQQANVDLQRAQNELNLSPLEQQLKAIQVKNALAQSKFLPNQLQTQELENQLRGLTAKEGIEYLNQGGAAKERQLKFDKLGADLAEIENKKKALDLSSQQIASDISLAPEVRKQKATELQQNATKLENERIKIQNEADQLKLLTQPSAGGPLQEPADVSNATTEQLRDLAAHFARLGRFDPSAKEKSEFYKAAATKSLMAEKKGEKPPTESEANAGIFGQRAIQAEKDVGEALKTFDPTAASPLTHPIQGPINTLNAINLPLIGGVVPNVMKGTDRQQYEQAKENFISAVLRKESGATISDSELRKADKLYFPQIGDSEKTIAQKAQTRAIAIKALNDIAQGKRPGASATAPSNAPNSGVTKSGVKYTIEP